MKYPDIARANFSSKNNHILKLVTRLTVIIR